MPLQQTQPLASSTCPLCGEIAGLILSDQQSYFQCPECYLIHVPAAQHLDDSAEKAVYDLHENYIDDPDYRHFLSRLLDPLLEQVTAPAHALEFGCGHGPALAAMLEEAGFTVRLYDPFYYPDPAPLNDCYQVITATEVVEHLARPGAELERLWKLLEPGGWLGMMTKRLPPLTMFASWHYRRDPTHIALFHDETFCYLANRWQAELKMPRSDVAMLRKPLSQ